MADCSSTRGPVQPLRVGRRQRGRPAHQTSGAATVEAKDPGPRGPGTVLDPELPPEVEVLIDRLRLHHQCSRSRLGRAIQELETERRASKVLLPRPKRMLGRDQRRSRGRPFQDNVWRKKARLDPEFRIWQDVYLLRHRTFCNPRAVQAILIRELSRRGRPS